MMQHRTAHSGAPSYAKNSQAIKPSVSFMNLSRENTKLKHFVDLQDGPSSLQKRDGVPTLKEKCVTPLIYENERSNHLKSTSSHMGTLKQIRTALFNDDPSNPHSAVMSQTLRTPKEARKEVETLRD